MNDNLHMKKIEADKYMTELKIHLSEISLYHLIRIELIIFC